MRWRRKKKAGPYRSGLEVKIAEDLQKRGIGFRYEGYSIPYKRRINSGECGDCGSGKIYQTRNYTPDFTFGDAENGSFIVEAKGRLTAADRGKMLAVKASNPTLDIRFIFARNNKLEKNKDARYSDWATKHGFQYFIGSSVPEEWLRGTSGVQDNRDETSDSPGPEPKARKARRSSRRAIRRNPL